MNDFKSFGESFQLSFSERNHKRGQKKDASEQPPEVIWGFKGNCQV